MYTVLPPLLPRRAQTSTRSSETSLVVALKLERVHGARFYDAATVVPALLLSLLVPEILPPDLTQNLLSLEAVACRPEGAVV